MKTNEKTLQWMVVDRLGNLYASSNSSTQKDAKERHYADLGQPWNKSYKQGDRLVRVSISIVKTLP
jgi:hypothetical protein